MIVQRIRVGETDVELHTEQLFINSGRLVVKESARGDSLTLKLDVQQNDPRYERVEIELMGRVTFIRRGPRGDVIPIDSQDRIKVSPDAKSE